MNRRLIGFAGVITAMVGAVIGVAVAEMAQPDYQSQLYQNMHRKYAVVGAVAGSLLGMGQETVRQIKQRRDQEEKALADHLSAWERQLDENGSRS